MASMVSFAFVAVIFCIVFRISILALRVDGRVKDSHSMNDSDAGLTPPQVIKKHGYPVEAHTIQSADGYFLELHRIPYGKSGRNDNKRIPILLHHGLLVSSNDWIINGPERSLGYRLADEGYDIWLANSRGNTFSRGHIKYNPSQNKFWDFSFHEMGIYDLPATIDHILEVTRQKKLLYIGHSLGTAVFYVMASTLPEYNDKIILQISLGPVGALPHTTSAFRLLVPYAKIANNILWQNGGVLLERDTLAKIMTKLFCGRKFFNTNICEHVFIFPLCGKDPDQFNTNLFPLISTNYPAGTSGKNIMHSAQLISSGSFQWYDYGKTENLKKYNTTIPPKYDINLIKIPVRLYYGENDILCNPLDTKLLYQQLSKPLGLVRINYDKFNHVDFTWAKDLNRLLNDEIIQFIKNSTHPENGSSFIENIIQNSMHERDNSVAPIDEPFDEKTLMEEIRKTLL